MIYTGLRRVIASPQDYKLNNEKNSFPSNYELAIPLEETNQRNARSSPVKDNEDDFASALGGLDDIDLKTPGRSEAKLVPTNLAQKRVTGGSIAEHFGSNAKLSSTRKIPSFGDCQYTPLRDINTFMHDWTIKVKVVGKSVRQWNNANGSGTIMNLDLMD